MALAHRITLHFGFDKGRGWFVSFTSYEGGKVKQHGIHAHYYRTRGAAVRGWAKTFSAML